MENLKGKYFLSFLYWYKVMQTALGVSEMHPAQYSQCCEHFKQNSIHLHYIVVKVEGCLKTGINKTKPMCMIHLGCILP